MRYFVVRFHFVSNHRMTDHDIIAGLYSKDRKIIEFFYVQHWAAIRKYVMQHSGTEEDAKDIYQESFLSLFLNIRDKKYTHQKSAKLSSYFFQICKYKWNDRLKSAHFQRSVSIYEVNKQSSTGNTELHGLEDNLKMKSMKIAFKMLDTRCKELLQMFYWREYSLAVIAEELDYSFESAKNAKYRCMKKLKNLALKNIKE